jgi:aspartyl-tRNA(Asn)/glutamyl-tRNA(Gln) amidotransferase subunit C
MPDITDDEVRRIARLARLHLQEKEVADLRHQLGRILEVFSVLQAADLAPNPLAPKAFGPGGDLRTDTPAASLPREEALAEAPDTADGHVRIPRVLG